MDKFGLQKNYGALLILGTDREHSATDKEADFLPADCFVGRVSKELIDGPRMSCLVEGGLGTDKEHSAHALGGGKAPHRRRRRTCLAPHRRRESPASVVLV